MPFKKGQSGNPKGRRKGAANKVTGAAKDAIALAAEGLGGTNRLIAWAKEDPLNERAFWTQIYPRLLPVQAEVSGPDGEALPHTIVNNYVAAAPVIDAPAR
jgi:hypothetical protein